MKKTTLLFSALLLALTFGLIRGQYAQVGHWIYSHATDLEASLYGFEQQTIDIGEMSLALYNNQPTTNNQPTNNNQQHNDRPVIVMLHGYSADKDVWPRFARHLSDDYHIIIPDMAGHGDSPFDPGWDYSMPAQAKRLALLLDRLGIRQVHIIGNSMGGFLSATFAIHYPQRVLSATMIDPAGVVAPELSDMARMLARGDNPFLIHNRTEFDDFYAMTMEQPPFLPDIVLEAVGQSYIERRDQLEKIFADFHASDYLDQQLHRLTAPALLWWGDKDRLLHVSSVPVWQQGVNNLQVEIWPGIGHMPMVEQPAEAADKYRHFLTTLAAE